MTVRFTLVGTVVGVGLASATVWVIEFLVTEFTVDAVRARAVDQVQLGVLSGMREEDFRPPHTAAGLAALGARLDPAVASLRQAGSGVIRVNVVDGDGTIIYSDTPTVRGQWLAPADKSELAAALGGSIGSTQHSSLSTVENADLKEPYGQAVEVYVPVQLNGHVVGAYEIYVAWGGIGGVLAAVWLVLVITVASLCVVLARWMTTHGSPERAAHDVRAPSPRWRAVSTEPERAPNLTPRELEVLTCMASSQTYKDIASELLISEETVRTHAKNVMRKLQQTDRLGAVLAAVQAGILHLPLPGRRPIG